jgi:hypothetical protein
MVGWPRVDLHHRTAGNRAFNGLPQPESGEELMMEFQAAEF